LNNYQACVNVEVAVAHKHPWCATIVVCAFLISVVISIIICSDSIKNQRRRLRGEPEYFSVY